MSRSSSFKRSQQTTRGRGRAGARPAAREQLSINDLRSETARRAIVVCGSNPAQVPMVVAVCALLVGSGRADFSETEIKAEVELLTAELRHRWGFTDEQRADGAELWSKALDSLNAYGIPESTLELWIRPFYSPGLVGGRLWLVTEKDHCTGAWTARRYRRLIDEALAVVEPDSEVKCAFMATDPREDGKP